MKHEKIDVAGFCLVVAACLALMAYCDPSRANELIQKQFNEMTQILDVTVNVETPGNGVNANAAPTTITTQGDSIDVTGPTFNVPEQTPNIYAGTIIPTGSCRGGFGVGVAVPGFGGSFQRAPKDPECDRRELARMFFAFGEVDFGLQLLCTATAVPEKLLDACPRTSTVNEYAKRVTEILLEESAKQ